MGAQYPPPKKQNTNAARWTKNTQAGRRLGGFQRRAGVAQRGGPGSREGDSVPLALDLERDDLPHRVQRRYSPEAFLPPPGVCECPPPPLPSLGLAKLPAWSLGIYCTAVLYEGVS